MTDRNDKPKTPTFERALTVVVPPYDFTGAGGHITLAWEEVESPEEVSAAVEQPLKLVLPDDYE